MENKIEEAYEQGILIGENQILKSILEQLLKIKLIPRLNIDSKDLI